MKLLSILRFFERDVKSPQYMNDNDKLNSNKTPSEDSVTSSLLECDDDSMGQVDILEESEEEKSSTVSEESSITEQEEKSSEGVKKEGDKGKDELFSKFLQELEDLTEPENKLKHVIDFMEKSLAQNGNPQFKSFWEARKLCLPLFKENINPALRTQLWKSYGELSHEARRLKEIFDEQSAFAVEQIEMAVTALEADIGDFDAQLEKVSDVEFPAPSETLKSKRSFYDRLQRIESSQYVCYAHQCAEKRTY